MKLPADENVGLPTGPALITASTSGAPPDSASASAEQDADTATNWQLRPDLKALLERDPALISSLLEDSHSSQPAIHAATLMAAAREALAARPDSADLHYHAARAAMRIGNTHEAADLLERALEMDPCHVAASALLSDVCMVLKEPHRAVAWLQRTLALRAVSTDPAPAARRNRRGNELFT